MLAQGGCGLSTSMSRRTRICLDEALAELRDYKDRLEQPHPMEQIHDFAITFVVVIAGGWLALEVETLNDLLDHTVLEAALVALFEHKHGLSEQLICFIDEDELVANSLEILTELSHCVHFGASCRHERLLFIEELLLSAKLEYDGRDALHGLLALFL